MIERVETNLLFMQMPEKDHRRPRGRRYRARPARRGCAHGNCMVHNYRRGRPRRAPCETPRIEGLMSKPTAVVVGVGAERGLGAALCRRFAQSGYHVLVAGRTQAKIGRVAETIAAAGGSAEPIAMDATRESDVAGLFERAMARGYGFDPTELVVSNAGNNQRIDFRELTSEQFEDFWRVGCFSGFLVGREAARRLVPLGRGSIIFTGASASIRGKPGFAHFAAAKAGLRMVAQSMARDYGPLGIHVAHVVIDGGIHGERLRKRAPTLDQGTWRGRSPRHRRDRGNLLADLLPTAFGMDARSRPASVQRTVLSESPRLFAPGALPASLDAEPLRWIRYGSASRCVGSCETVVDWAHGSRPSYSTAG